MTQSYTQFQINSLRSVNLQRTLEAIMVFIAALFVSALLPSLLLQYLYANQQLTKAPLILEHMSAVTFAIAIGYLLFVIFGIITRGKKISQLERELAIMVDSSTEQLPDEAELKELEALVDEALKNSKRKTRTSKKTTKRKTTSKKS